MTQTRNDIELLNICLGLANGYPPIDLHNQAKICKLETRRESHLRKILVFDYVDKYKTSSRKTGCASKVRVVNTCGKNRTTKLWVFSLKNISLEHKRS